MEFSQTHQEIPEILTNVLQRPSIQRYSLSSPRPSTGILEHRILLIRKIHEGYVGIPAQLRIFSENLCLLLVTVPIV
jgi:hypothetical protein